MKKIFRIIIFPILIIVALKGPAFSQYTTDTKLERALKSLTDSFHGVSGVYTRNLKTGKEAEINADTIFPTASIVKVPILIGIFNKIQQGDYTYHQPLVYSDSMAHGGSGLMQFFKDSTKTTLSTIITLMITHSDNTAAIWCEKLAGGGVTINKWLEEHGFQSTRVNSRTPGRKEDYAQFGWGQTTPREMSNLMVMIRDDKAVSPAASQRMYRILTHEYWDEYALSQIPPYVQAASKQGMVDDSRSEAVLVNAPHGDYVFYIATKNNKDQRWEPDNEAWELARKVSALLWQYYEPDSNWKPDASYQNYFK